MGNKLSACNLALIPKGKVVARHNPPEGSPLTSLANSSRVIKNSSVLESVCSYGDMVRVSSPFRDVKVEQENIVALDAVI